MKKILKFFDDHFEEYILMVLMGALAIVVFAQVICRGIGSSLPWSEELSRYITVWVTFVGTSLGFKRGSHIGVEAFKMIFPRNPRKFVDLLGAMICVLLCFLCIKYGIDVVKSQILMGQKSPAMHLPMWIAYIAIPIGIALALIRCIQNFVNIFRGKTDSVTEIEAMNAAAQEKGGND
ncbi:MAG: TRAP transporter small permease [Oscillospiraceae bacterium]